MNCQFTKTKITQTIVVQVTFEQILLIPLHDCNIKYQMTNHLYYLVILLDNIDPSNKTSHELKLNPIHFENFNRIIQSCHHLSIRHMESLLEHFSKILWTTIIILIVLICSLLVFMKYKKITTMIPY